MNLMNVLSIQNLVILNNLKHNNNNQFKILKEFHNNHHILIYLEVKTIDIFIYFIYIYISIINNLYIQESSIYYSYSVITLFII